jgi:hypothetical protein
MFRKPLAINREAYLNLYVKEAASNSFRIYHAPFEIDTSSLPE